MDNHCVKYKIIDNFLNKDFYQDIKNFLHGEKINWYYRTKETEDTLNTNGFFSFCWYNNWMPDSPYFETQIKPILKQLKCVAPLQVRANMTLPTLNKESCAWHTDYGNFKGYKTAILYFTSCSANTLLKIDNEIITVNSCENRILIFEGDIEHKVVYGDDYIKRIVINFNWF